MNIIPSFCRGQILGCLNLKYTNRMFAHKFKRKICLQRMVVANSEPMFKYLFRTDIVLCEPAVAKRKLKIFSATTQKVCWNCTHNIHAGTIFCKSCSCLQPVDKSCGLFGIIGIKSSFKINPQELKQKYRDLQSVLHPDKFSSKSKKEQELSEEFSSYINKAYTTLLDPLERGFYLLKLQNMTVEENTTEMDKSFLMHIMELNEELEDESSPQKLSELSISNREQINSLVSQVEEAFENNNEQQAKELLSKMKYYYSIEKKIKEVKQRLNIPD